MQPINIVPENLLLHLPDEIEFETVASSLLKGVTAYFLMHDIYKVGKEDTIIFHAAAGGVGSIASKAGQSHLERLSLAQLDLTKKLITQSQMAVIMLLTLAKNLLKMQPLKLLIMKVSLLFMTP